METLDADAGELINVYIFYQFADIVARYLFSILYAREYAR